MRSICAGILLILIPFICFAQNQDPQPQEPAPLAPKQKPVLLYGEITADNINIRTDSTVSSQIICAVNRGEPVEIVKESYDWYKVRLPKTAPAFINRNLVEPIDEKTAKVSGDNVNIRLNPDQSSPILGKAQRNEIINLVAERVGWYKIEPTSDTLGWVHKRFVAKSDTAKKKEEDKPAQGTAKEAPDEENVSIEGIIKPYGRVFRRIATHKLIAMDKSVFLLKGNKSSLDSLNNHKIKVTGKISPHPENQRYPIIEIQKIEVLD